MHQKSLFNGTLVSIFCFFCTRSDLSAEKSFLFMSILSKCLHPSAESGTIQIRELFSICPAGRHGYNVKGECLMEWTDIRLTVAKADAENAEAVATLIAEGGIYIEDYSDIE